MKKPNEVFIPGALPESTYITRVMESGFTYEERLRQALSVSGYLTLISGPSKIGKTVLCEKVIGLDHLVEISGDRHESRNAARGNYQAERPEARLYGGDLFFDERKRHELF